MAAPSESLQKEDTADTPATQSLTVEDDDDETCGFCKFMKAGGCRDEFVAWSKCVDKEKEAGKDFTEECREKTQQLQECMQENRDYYAPMLEDMEASLEAPASTEPGTDSLHAASAAAGTINAAGEGSGKQEVSEGAEEGGSGAVEASPGSEGEDEGAEQEEGEEEAAPEVVVQTAPYDRRFPSVNQARHCYTRYNEYHKCVAEKGEEDEACKFYQRAYRSICPGDWVDNWNEQREAGTWPGRF